jgi:hypothetical protein
MVCARALSRYSPVVYAVAYVSSEAMRFSDQDLQDLLNESRGKNKTAGITGLLLFKDGNFMQLLEGPKEVVLALMTRIKSDRRHRSVRLLMEEEIQDREFSDWAMAFRKLNSETVTDCPGYSDFLEVPLTNDHVCGDPSKSRRCLQIFKKSVF